MCFKWYVLQNNEAINQLTNSNLNRKFPEYVIVVKYVYYALRQIEKVFLFNLFIFFLDSYEINDW